ncbi:hypothetical protein TIFTF001_035919 [Ficus carica]|uniref:Uncharacterized protein n=1 Tax=Ficus carica TaxID=3494 RepID=A0AA88E3C4_FICCA|nr:hypothetical protein TIFTF001_035919 [Ficus carica]
MTRGSAQDGVGIRVKVSSIPVVGSAWAPDSMLGPRLKAGTRTRTRTSPNLPVVVVQGPPGTGNDDGLVRNKALK